jgi:hypothetical protein
MGHAGVRSLFDTAKFFDIRDSGVPNLPPTMTPSVNDGVVWLFNVSKCCV